ncbi:MAG TPA: hypothetical protein VI796_05275 [Candidatus Thermoplasmatota archaeon]|nr:hypothetical protein [Candidatus Thermoplasmatota archaeon]
MPILARPPEPAFARPGANPTLETQEYIRAVLEGAHRPVSRNEILRLLSSWGHGTSRPSLNAVVGYLARDGMVVEGSKGLQWAPQAEGSILETIRRKRTP